MKKTLLAVVLFTLSAGVSAEWVRIASGDGKDIYVDHSTIRRTGKKAKMWHLLDFWAPKYPTVGSPYMSSKGQVEFDCKDELSRQLYFSSHSERMGGGDTIESLTVKSPVWEPIPPESIVEGFWKIACRG